MLKTPISKTLTILLAGGICAGAILYHHRPFSTRMAAYVTDLSSRSEAQRTNIERAQQRLSGLVLPPGSTFSLNEEIGPYTPERGYRPERSFQGKEVVWTPGGGVCQVASTLYNVARIAGLKILERVPHSQAVQSVPTGMDATLAFGIADLKLRNSYPFPIKIISHIAQDQLKIEIWGKEVGVKLFAKESKDEL